MGDTREQFPVLVVDDDVSVRSTLCDIVEAAGFHPVPAANGKEGWDLFQSENPDIILSDIRMPLMDGLELVERIRQTYDLTEKYIMIVSGIGDPETAVQSLNVGANDFIRKPFSALEIIAKLQTALRTIHSGQRKAASITAPALAAGVDNLVSRYRTELSRATRHGRELSCLVMAIRNIDTFIADNPPGVSDAWFRQSFLVLQELLRCHDVIGQYAEDQVGIVLPETQQDQARTVSRKIHESLSNAAMSVPNLAVEPVISVGIAGYDVNTRSNHVLERAAQAAGSTTFRNDHVR